jgi:hypothetical protein
MKQAYKLADGRKIEDKRVLVDVERGRTVPNWCAPPAAAPLHKRARPGRGNMLRGCCLL